VYSLQYEVSDDQDSVQMLQRSSQVGEFYRMSPPAVWESTKPLPQTYMDIMIYDEESDRHVHIPFAQALYATGYGADNGPVGDLFDLATKLEEPDVKKNIEAAGGTVADLKTLVVNEKGESKLTTAAACKTLVDKLIELVKDGRWVPVEIVIARPFIEHLMLSAVVTVAGRDTGATLFGPADMYAADLLVNRNPLAHSVLPLTLLPRLSSQADLGQHLGEDH